MPEQHSGWRYVASVSLAIGIGLALPASASADPVQITSGTLTWIGSESASITASSASGELSMNVFGELGRFGPYDCIAVPECGPGTTVPLTAFWGGSDLPGTATFQGTTYLLGGQSNTSAHANMRWDGALTLPLDFTGGTLMAPFTFSGLFGYTPAPGLGETAVPLTGLGTATLTFAPSGGFPGAFSLAAAHYDFEPTPEPASLILLATGIAGTWATRRRHSPPCD
jgi:hypothetical protein